MAAGDTKTSICSVALFHLAAPPLGDFNAPVTPIEKQVVGNYGVILNSELRRRDWIFAIRRTNFSDPSDPAKYPDFNRYRLPDDSLRVLRERDLHTFTSDPSWWIEGRDVCSRRHKAPKIRYISNAVDPGDFDPLFVMVLSYKLALHCCEYVTQSTQKKNDLASLYKSAISEAGKQNAWEQPIGSTHANYNSFSWENARSYSIL